MDENLQPVSERRVDQDLRCAIDLLRLDIARVHVVLTDAPWTPDKRGQTLAGALNKSFDSLIQAVRTSWNQRGLSHAGLLD